MGNKKMALRKGAAKEEKEWRDWSSLTEPLLLCIISLFTTLQDFFAFRGVCRCWRSAATPNLQTMSSQSPLLLFHRPVGFFNNPTRTLFDMARDLHYSIVPPYGDIFGYSHGHLFQHVQSSKSSYIVLINLFTGTRTLRLPTRRSVLKPYRFRLSSSLSSPGCLAIFQPRKYEAFHYCHITEPRRCFGKWKQWAKTDVEDLLFFSSRLYVLTKLMELWVLDPLCDPWDLVLLEATPPVSAQAKCRNCNRYLADSDGELLIVCKECNGCGSIFEQYFIWRWSFESGGGWVAVSSLGPRSLFFDRRGFVGSVPIPESSGFRQNCIYIIERCRYSVSYYLGEDKFRARHWGLPYVADNVEPPFWILPSII